MSYADHWEDTDQVYVRGVNSLKKISKLSLSLSCFKIIFRILETAAPMASQSWWSEVVAECDLLEGRWDSAEPFIWQVQTQNGQVWDGIHDFSTRHNGSFKDKRRETRWVGPTSVRKRRLLDRWEKTSQNALAPAPTMLNDHGDGKPNLRAAIGFD